MASANTSTNLQFRGVAHPPPKRGGRECAADLNAAEIGTTNLGRKGGTPLLVEHDHCARAGRVLASWEGLNGELRVAGVVDDASMAQTVRSGGMRGLSLGTGVTMDTDGNDHMRTQDELSLCTEPRRAGCYIDTLDGRPVRAVSAFSKRGALAQPPPLPAKQHVSG